MNKEERNARRTKIQLGEKDGKELQIKRYIKKVNGREIVSPIKPKFAYRLKKNKELARLDSDKNLVNTIRDLTDNFRQEKPLQDVMEMFSMKKGASKFRNIEAYERYNALVRKLNYYMSLNKNNYERAYRGLLSEYSEDTVEHKIIKKYLDRLIEKNNER